MKTLKFPEFNTKAGLVEAGDTITYLGENGTELTSIVLPSVANPDKITTVDLLTGEVVFLSPETPVKIIH